MLHDLPSLSRRLLTCKVGRRASRACLPTCHVSGAPRRQCVRDAFRNYKAQLGLELFFSSGCTAGDEGGREGECATEEEVQKVARQDRRQPTSLSLAREDSMVPLLR